jgi:hypothetical protein
MSSILLLAGFVLVVFVAAYFGWDKIKGLFRDSETLFWARFQMIFGGVWEVLVQTDLAPLLNSAGLGRWSPVILMVMGIITEVARRSRATDL